MMTALGYMGIKMDYALLNNWTQSFAIIKYDEKGNFQLDNRKIHKGDIY